MKTIIISHCIQQDKLVKEIFSLYHILTLWKHKLVMINSRSVAVSFAKQMSGFRNSSSTKAAKGFATANKYSTSSSASLLHSTSPLTCNEVSCSLSLSVVFFFFFTHQIFFRFVRICCLASEILTSIVQG